MKQIGLVVVAAVLALAVAPSAFARDYQLGTCTVRQNAPAPTCTDVRGKSATGVSPGTSHDACTDAKANARTNLLAGIAAACGSAIDCGSPCQTIQKQ